MKHFTRKEFEHSDIAVRYGINNTLPNNLIQNMEQTLDFMETVRNILSNPITITSGYRCDALNKVINGSQTSQHVKAQAVDFVCWGFGSPKKICNKILDHDLGFDQLILEGKKWVHISMSTNPRGDVLTAEFTPQGTIYYQGIV